MKRRDFCKLPVLGIPLLLSCDPSPTDNGDNSGKDGITCSLSTLFWIKDIPNPPFFLGSTTHHSGIENLLSLMSEQGLMFYRSPDSGVRQGPRGLISADDVVLIKVNAQWKYRGCTNSDLVAGLIQVILEHPDGFAGEVVIVENGQGRGSLKCDNRAAYPNDEVHANACDETHSFFYLANDLFRDSRVGAVLLDPVRQTFISENDHDTDGYRIFEDVSYPCFTTPRKNRVELREGIWADGKFTQNLKLINVPVLKHHVGSQFTGAMKHMYGVLSMDDGQWAKRHFNHFGETCGKMIASVRQPVLNILDAIWVSQSALRGYPADKTTQVNQILASQDPVALDYWGAKYILYPINQNERHHPDYPVIDSWLAEAQLIINQRGGLYNYSQDMLEDVTKEESEMIVFTGEL